MQESQWVTNLKTVVTPIAGFILIMAGCIALLMGNLQGGEYLIGGGGILLGAWRVIPRLSGPDSTEGAPQANQNVPTNSTPTPQVIVVPASAQVTPVPDAPVAQPATNETVRDDPGTSIPTSMSGPKPQPDLSSYSDPDLPSELQAVVDMWIQRQVMSPFVVPNIPEPTVGPDEFMSLRDRRMKQEADAETAVGPAITALWDRQKDTNGLIMSYPCGSKARGAIANCYTEAQQRWEHYAVQLCEWVYP